MINRKFQIFLSLYMFYTHKYIYNVHILNLYKYPNRNVNCKQLEIFFRKSSTCGVLEITNIGPCMFTDSYPAECVQFQGGCLHFV